MMPDIEALHTIETSDIHRAAVTLACAFHQGAPWTQFFREGATLDQKAVFFEIPVRMAMRYGTVCATSARCEGVAVWLPDAYSKLTLWRALRCGVVPSALRTLRVGTPLLWKQDAILAPLDQFREARMGGPHLHLMFVGVQPAYQGQGLGSALVRAVIDDGNTTGLPIYLETQSPKTVAWYEKLGFRVLGKVMLKLMDLTYYGMVKEPLEAAVM